MISRKSVRLTLLATIAVAGAFAYVAPAYNIEQARLDDQPVINDTVTIRPWGEDLSADAVESNGIERDLDGNASALMPSDRLLHQL